jgi:hypothetical protein
MEQQNMEHTEEDWTLDSYTADSYTVQCKSIYSKEKSIKYITAYIFKPRSHEHTIWTVSLSSVMDYMATHTLQITAFWNVTSCSLVDQLLEKCASYIFSTEHGRNTFLQDPMASHPRLQ